APLRDAGVRVVTLGKQGRWDLLGPLRRMIAAVRDFRPAVVHGYLPDGNPLALFLGRWGAHARAGSGGRASAYDWHIYDFLVRVIFRASAVRSGRADLIIANSEAGRTYHVTEGYPGARTVVIPNGIDTVRFRPDPAAREATRQRWGIEPATPLIGIVGRLDPMKDHSTFLRGAALIARSRPEARFV